MTKYQLYYNDKVIGTFNSEDLAMEAFYKDKKQFKDLNSYVRAYTIDDITTIDFGSHFNFYYILRRLWNE